MSLPPVAAKVQRETTVSLRSVDKTYDGITNIVDTLDLDIYKGEFLSLLGPSGSGKTTGLMMLAGFEEPSSGQILLNGSAINRLPPYRRNMGVVFQNYALFPHMSVARNVAYPLKMRGCPREEMQRRVSETLDLVGLRGFDDRLPNQLSGGQQQRVALARALVFEPSIVLMDEPLGALDKQLREQMQYEIKRIHERLGLTAVYVTHDQGEALTMSDRIAVFSGGRIQQIGSASDIYERPMTTFVANFIGENNSLDGVVDEIFDEECRVRVAKGGTVVATAAPGLASGDEVAICVRPERIKVGKAGVSPNLFAATIENMIYVGDHMRLELTIMNGVKLTAKISVSEEASGLAVGDKVEVGWMPRHCRAVRPN